MRGSTHAMVGLVVGLVICRAQPLPSVFTLGCISTLAALVPDIDHPQSKLGRRVVVGALIFRHRGFTHSLLALALLMLACWHWLPYPLALVVGAGYGSHLLLDALNPQGVPLLYPIKWRVSLFKFRTGGLADSALGFCAALGAFILLAWVSTGRSW